MSSPQDRSGFEGTIEIPHTGPRWRRWLAVTGPAMMVAVGYMDPGNWATDLAGGSRYGYKLVWVLLLSNIIALLLQSLTVRLGLVTRRDLAQSCRETFPPIVNLPLYALAEIAITATDLAEVIGSAIALNLLFHIPLSWGVVITAADSFLLIGLSHFGIRKLELVVFGLVGIIAMGFLVEFFLISPDWGELAMGFVPSMPDMGALYISLGILGATVMPHNLYLHSSLVQSRKHGPSEAHLRQALRWNNIDSGVSLNLAFLINLSILVMAAAVFHTSGHADVADIGDAHRLLEPLLGAKIAPIAFAVALLASGQSSTITGTLAGQIVMEGYLNLRVRPWLRRLITRLSAVIPALVIMRFAGENSIGGLLVLSQVVLSLQLPFAVIPLIHFTGDRNRMGRFAIGKTMKIAAWVVALIIVGLNLSLASGEISSWIRARANPEVLWAIVIPLSILLCVLLLVITFGPWLAGLFRRPSKDEQLIHRDAQPLTPVIAPSPLTKVLVALDFSGRERKLLEETVKLLGAARPQLILVHVVESPSSMAFRKLSDDAETDADRTRLENHAAALRPLGFEVQTVLGAGHPVSELARIVGEVSPDLVVMGGHGHRGLGDLLHGSTADALRHRVKVNVLVVALKSGA